MKKAGGIIALIGSIFGVLSAFATLSLGGLGSLHTWGISSLSILKQFERAYYGFVMNEPGIMFNYHSRWVVVSFVGATFMLSVIYLIVPKRFPAFLLIICAATAAFISGGQIAIFMSMALVGGILALFPKPKQPQYA
ncbi:MAG: hypothetical protein OXG24_02255 [Gammaproteobacteria bacterium]|nr:hypothetical protein [Gammaproteobacteria bacterium]